MTEQERRIKLAEAMGLKDSFGFSPDRNFPFDPFTDANDDYAVLEWMRRHQLQEIDHKEEGGYLEWCAFRKELCEPVENGLRLVKAVDEYQIGDYARAALRVLT